LLKFFIGLDGCSAIQHNLLKLIIQNMDEGGGHILHEEATHQVPAGTSNAG
jgi:hypothetical protein